MGLCGPGPGLALFRKLEKTAHDPRRLPRRNPAPYPLQEEALERGDALPPQQRGGRALGTVVGEAVGVAGQLAPRLPVPQGRRHRARRHDLLQRGRDEGLGLGLGVARPLAVEGTLSHFRPVVVGRVRGEHVQGEGLMGQPYFGGRWRRFGGHVGWEQADGRRDETAHVIVGGPGGSDECFFVVVALIYEHPLERGIVNEVFRCVRPRGYGNERRVILFLFFPVLKMR